MSRRALYRPTLIHSVMRWPRSGRHALPGMEPVEGDRGDQEADRGAGGIGGRSGSARGARFLDQATRAYDAENAVRGRGGYLCVRHEVG